MNRDEIVADFLKYGFYIPKNDVIWRVTDRIGDNKYKYRVGWEVGRYWHSCHVDSTLFIVLLIDNRNDGNRFVVQSFSDRFLEKIHT